MLGYIDAPSNDMHGIQLLLTYSFLLVTNGLELFKAFFKYFRDVDDSVQQ